VDDLRTNDTHNVFYSRDGSGVQYRNRETGLLDRPDGPAVYTGEDEQFWYKNGVLHRDDGPALIVGKTEIYFKDGVMHRDDGPALVMDVPDIGRTYTCWFKDGVAHRDDGPCIEFSDNRKVYVRNGTIHRDDGPAVENASGDTMWVQRGILHRLDGPAIISKHGSYHFQYGERVAAAERPTFAASKNNSRDVRNYAKWMAAKLGGTLSYEDSEQYCVSFQNGDERWYKAGTTEKHRVGGPAVSYFGGSKVWYNNGRIHRSDGPAIEHSCGDKMWYKDGVLHNSMGPAIVTKSGHTYYYTDGKFNSPNVFTPAISYTDGTCAYFKDGILHRDTGRPALLLAEEGGTYTTVYIKDGNLHTDDITRPAIEWGAGSKFTPEALEFLRNHVNGSLRKHLADYMYSGRKPVNRSDFYRNNQLIAEISNTEDKPVSMQAISVGDTSVSISGTAKVSGSLTWEGLNGVEISDGELRVSSTRDVTITNCIIRNAKVIVDIPEGNHVVLSGNYMTKSSLFADNVTQLKEDIMYDSSVDKKSMFIQSRRPIISSDSGISEDDMLALKRMHDAFSAAKSAEPFLTEDEISSISEQTSPLPEEPELEDEKLRHMTVDEMRDYAIGHLREKFGDAVGQKTDDSSIQKIESQIYDSLSELGASNISIYKNGDTIEGHAEIRPEHVLKSVDITFDISDTENKQSNVKKDENSGDDAAWAIAAAALGVTAMLSCLVKPDKNVTKLQKKEVANAAV
jgi:hypothetical protein